METTTPTTASHPAVLAALAEITPLRAQRATLEAEYAEIHRLTSYTTRFSHEPEEAASPEAIAHARWRRPHVEGELLALRAAEVVAERKLGEAEAAAKAEIGAALRERYRAAIARLDAELTRAANANAAVAELDAQAHAVLGTAAPAFALHELRPATAAEDTRLDAWRRWCCDHGLM
jgi:hypothetical protein